MSAADEETTVTKRQRALDATQARTEAMARLICAERIGAVRDVLGVKIPEDYWEQYMPKAAAIMVLIGNTQ